MGNGIKRKKSQSFAGIEGDSNTNIPAEAVYKFIMPKVTVITTSKLPVIRAAHRMPLAKGVFGFMAIDLIMANDSVI